MRSVCSLLSHVAGLATFTRNESADALGRINCNASAYMCAAALMMVLAPALIAGAQCGPQWLPMGNESAFNNNVYSFGVWDPDGDGPLEPLIIAGGSFSAVGIVAASRVVTWDGVAWHPLGPGLDGHVRTITSHPDGRLLVGGSFRNSGSMPVSFVGFWDGSAWQSLGSGVNDIVMDVEVLPDGDIMACGVFTHAGAETARRVARWDGVTWTEMGGFTSGSVNAIGVLQGGDIVVGGTMPGYLWRWNGVGWSTFPDGTPSHAVRGIDPNPNGGFDLAGNFDMVGPLGVRCFARYDGFSWSRCGDGFNDPTQCSVRMPNGDVIVGGGFGPMPDGPSTTGIVRWNGSAWNAMGPGMDSAVLCLLVAPSGELLVGGTFSTAGGAPAPKFARWSETGIPWVAYQPQDQALEVGDDLVLSAVPATSYKDVSFQWQKNGSDIEGATGTLATPTNGQPALLLIESVLPSDAGEYSVVFTNPCGSVSSDTVGVSVSGLCPADYNASGSAGDVLDFLDFFDDFGACVGGPGPCGEYGDADVNGDTIVDVLDFLDFLDAFGQGC